MNMQQLLDTVAILAKGTDPAQVNIYTDHDQLWLGGPGVAGANLTEAEQQRLAELGWASEDEGIWSSFA